MKTKSIIYGRTIGSQVLILTLCFAATAVTSCSANNDDPNEQPPVAQPVPKPQPAELPPTSEKLEFLPALEAAERRILAELVGPTDVAFSDTPLTDVIQFLAEYHNIPIILDAEALNETAIPLDLPITRTLTGVKLQSMLRVVLEPQKLAFVVEDEVLKITTRQRADRCLTTRVYPIADLCPGDGDAKSLVAAIQKTVATNWETDPPALRPFQEAGGAAPVQLAKVGIAKIVAMETAGSLIVTQTYDGHNQVLQLLRMLREAKSLSRKNG